MSCLPAPGFCLCHLLSSADFFLPAMPPVAPAVRTLGPRAVRFAVTFVAIRHRQAASTRSRLLEERSATSQSPGRLQLVAPPAIPEPGSAASALEPLLDPPPTQGCANSTHGIPGGCPAGKAVWTRLIITPGKLRGAM